MKIASWKAIVPVELFLSVVINDVDLDVALSPTDDGNNRAISWNSTSFKLSWQALYQFQVRRNAANIIEGTSNLFKIFLQTSNLLRDHLQRLNSKLRWIVYEDIQALWTKKKKKKKRNILVSLAEQLSNGSTTLTQESIESHWCVQRRVTIQVVSLSVIRRPRAIIVQEHREVKLSRHEKEKAKNAYCNAKRSCYGISVLKYWLRLSDVKLPRYSIISLASINWKTLEIARRRLHTYVNKSVINRKQIVNHG